MSRLEAIFDTPLKNDSVKYHHRYNMLFCTMGKQKPSRIGKPSPRQPKNQKANKTVQITKKELRTRLLARRRKHSPHTKTMEGKGKLFVRSVEPENLTCNICMEILMMPFSLKCGHTFCFYCLDSLSQHSSVCDFCPCCRNPIGDNYPTRNRILETIVPLLLEQLSEGEVRSYWERKKKMFDQFEKRAEQYRGVRENEKIDFKVGNHWQVGRVKRIYQKENKKKIEVQASSSQIVYVFNDSSTHLAHYRSFSHENNLCIDDFLLLDSFPLDSQQIPLFWLPQMS